MVVRSKSCKLVVASIRNCVSIASGSILYCIYQEFVDSCTYIALFFSVWTSLLVGFISLMDFLISFSLFTGLTPPATFAFSFDNKERSLYVVEYLEREALFDFFFFFLQLDKMGRWGLKIELVICCIITEISLVFLLTHFYYGTIVIANFSLPQSWYALSISYEIINYQGRVM